MAVDYLIVGSGLFGAVFARQAVDAGKSVLVLEKRAHCGGNIYSEDRDGIQFHVYGPHIFHTSNSDVWAYVNRFAQFNHYVNRPKVSYQNRLFSFPINLMTLYQLWGVQTPDAAQKLLEKKRIDIANPQNLEEWILSQVGEEIYEIFIKGYTTKQWGRPPAELPTFIIRRLPIRLNFDDNYFTDCYQGIPLGGYTAMVQALLDGIPVEYGVDYLANRAHWNAKAKVVVYTGGIDAFYDYQFGELDYRTLRFESKKLATPDYQGNAVINYTDVSIPYTRVCEHRHFDCHITDPLPHTWVTWEYPDIWDRSKIPYYPVNDEKNMAVYRHYEALAASESGVIFGGRLATYKYLDMHHVIAQALAKSAQVLG